MRTKFCWKTIALLLFFAALSATGQNPQDIRQQYVGKTVVLRGLYDGSELKFDGDGKLIGNAEGGHWTTARVEITNIDFRHDQLVIKGNRQALVLAEGGSIQTVYQGRRQRWDRPADEPAKTTISIHVTDPAQWSAALKNVFVEQQDEKSVAPPYWRDYLAHVETPPIPAGEVFRTLPDGTKVYKCGGPVHCPKALYAPDPEYSDAARAARYQAGAVFEAVVGSDGRAQDIQIKKPAGMGLDEIAYRCLQDWKFSPATLDGNPVAVLLNVQFRWRLY